MSAYLTNHELAVFITTSSPIPQSLNALICNQFTDGIVPSHLDLKITVAPATSVVIVDDLEVSGQIASETVRGECRSHPSIHFARYASQNTQGDRCIEPFERSNTSPAPLNHTITLVLNQNSALDYRIHANTQSPATTAPVLKNITVHLIGTGAQANVRYDCYGTDNKTLSIKTLQDHQAPHTTSSVTIKGVFDGQASLNTHNTIRIHKAAQHSNATQSNKNILLSKDARVVTTPQLEIEANDVVCKHGAAVSPLSPEHVFYLQSRGLDISASRDLLIQAFLA